MNATRPKEAVALRNVEALERNRQVPERVLNRLQDWADFISVWLEKRAYWFLAGFSIFYFASTVWLASVKRFWFDELFTHYISTQPSIGDVWTALARGIDHHPLPFFVLTRAGYALVDNVHIAARLPEMLGYYVFTICLFLFVARRTGALYGALAMTIPLVTPAFDYAYEARPYGVVIGFSAVALLCWQRAAEGGRRGLWLGGFVFGIAGALSSSYWGILVVVPFILAELVRTVHRRRVDLPVWTCLAAGASVFLIYLPQALGSVSRFAAGRNWASPYPTAVIDIYHNLLRGAFFLSIVLLAASTIYLVLFPWGQAKDREAAREAPSLPSHELAATLGFLLLPVLGYISSELLTNVISPRYMLPVIIGFSTTLTFMLFRITRGSALFGVAAVALTLLAYGVSIPLTARAIQNRSQSTLREFLTGQSETLPIVIDDPLYAMESMHYEPPEIADRIYYLVEPQSQRRYGDIPYQGTTWLKMREIFPIRAERLSTFRRNHKEFLVATMRPDHAYILPTLLADGVTIQLVASKGNDRLFHVRDGS
jgi:hypothetical protein